MTREGTTTGGPTALRRAGPALAVGALAAVAVSALISYVSQQLNAPFHTLEARLPDHAVRVLTAPLPATVALEDMTWVEVRSGIAAGYTTAIVPTGGVEQNGPHMILGKHGLIVSAAAHRIATSLGHTLVAPTINYVPEGEFNPASGHMRFPGTIGVTEPVFAGILEGAARSLKAAGFKTIVFIGDHGANQAPQAAVAERLSKEWVRDGVRVAHIQAYYDDAAQTARLLKDGFTRDEIGEHASLIDTSELLSVRPDSVKLDRFQPASSGTEENGARGDPRKANAKLGAELLQMRIDAAVAEIKSQLAIN